MVVLYSCCGVFSLILIIDTMCSVVFVVVVEDDDNDLFFVVLFYCWFNYGCAVITSSCRQVFTFEISMLGRGGQSSGPASLLSSFCSVAVLILLLFLVFIGLC